MRTHPIRAAEKQEGKALHARQQPLAAQGVRERSGLAATLLALQSTHGNRFVQRFLADATRSDSDALSEVEEAIERTRGSGQALYPGVRAQMESAFGADFSHVRLHTDANADTLNRSLSAVAFTTGRDVYFRQGVYDPEGATGRRLLAHELTHVMQQSGGTPHGDMVVGAPDDMYEQEAEHMADEVVQTLEHETPRQSQVAGHAHTDVQRTCTKCLQEEKQK
jgi:hypothetical protein